MYMEPNNISGNKKPVDNPSNDKDAKRESNPLQDDNKLEESLTDEELDNELKVHEAQTERD